MQFKILTLPKPQFEATCRRLRETVESSGFNYDAVIGIPRGGDFIIDAAWADAPRLTIALHRPPKGALKKRLSHLIRLLPLKVKDRLRIWEAKRLLTRQGHMSSTHITLPSIPYEVKKVLLIDDAVDTGDTLKAVSDLIKETYPSLEVRTAALTVTASQPEIMPDYYLYHDHTLIRAPWAIDMK